VTADAKEKSFGAVDPALTYQAETVSTGRGLLAGEVLSGDLTRAAGETSGTHQIQQGSVDNTANQNYDVSFVVADLTIKSEQKEVIPSLPSTLPSVIPGGTPVQLPVMPDPATGGTIPGTPVDPVAIPVAPASIGSAGLDNGSGAATAPGGTSVSGGFINARQLVLEQPVSGMFIYPIPENTFSHNNSKAIVALEARMADGAPLPEWMAFDSVRKIVSGTAPKGVSGEFKIILIARDQFGGEARTVLRVKVGR
jgi:hypothetical protein